MSLSVEEPSPLPTGNRRNRNFLAFALARVVGTAEGEDLASEGSFHFSLCPDGGAPRGGGAHRNPLHRQQPHVSSKGNLFPFGKTDGLGRAGGSAANGKAVKGGASLRTLGESPRSRERIAKDADAILVLREDIPETTVASFRE